MTAPNLTLRDDVYNLLVVKQALSYFNINSWTIGKRLYPQTARENLLPAGQIWIVAMSWDQAVNHSRTNVHEGEIPVQIGIQAAVAPTDDSAMESFVNLEYMIRELLWDLDGYQCLRIEALRDPNGVPYHYATLREQAVFDTYFTAYFKKIFP